MKWAQKQIEVRSLRRESLSLWMHRWSFAVGYSCYNTNRIEKSQILTRLTGRQSIDYFPFKFTVDFTTRWSIWDHEKMWCKGCGIVLSWSSGRVKISQESWLNWISITFRTGWTDSSCKNLNRNFEITVRGNVNITFDLCSSFLLINMQEEKYLLSTVNAIRLLVKQLPHLASNKRELISFLFPHLLQLIFCKFVRTCAGTSSACRICSFGCFRKIGINSSTFSPILIHCDSCQWLVRTWSTGSRIKSFQIRITCSKTT